MKARLPKAYQKKRKNEVNREFAANIIRHVCKGFLVVMYKKYGWRKKRCSELITEVIDYLNNHYDEDEAAKILSELDLSHISDSSEI